ncbi:MAG TPA: PSD1 and planctomycete cytochrome C domain-containing protein [Bryobacterales bacterium]|nr:PSD1 and planctomycete cytochrome C domain-containing protein [Bryobacterales bacterium]
MLARRWARRVGWAALLAAVPAWGASTDPVDFFKSRVRPILINHCYACHTNLKMGGLQLDSREHVLQGGNSGAVVLPGNPDQSLLIRAVSYTHERLRMPPQGKLADEQIADLRTWVASGVHWAEASSPVSVKSAEYVITPEQRKFWAFQPVRRPAIPAVRDGDWPKSPIDHFVLAQLESRGLQPVRPADRRTLIRRATFDLIGLPPAPEEVEDFLKDSSPEAFAKVVDRLLASPRYGERWGRFWLDVARYADEDMLFPAGDPFPNAFRYRDWVIQAFNDDMPYDLFIKSQIAGDLLEKDAGRPLRAGLGLFALGPWYYKIVEPPKARADERHDRIDVLTRGFLGLTVACARCHNHKYDPIPTTDYYALAGVFADTEYKEYPLAPEAVVKAYDEQQKRITDQEERIKKALEAERKRVAAALAKDTSRYLLAAASSRDATGLDQETLDRFRKYLAAPEKAHPFLSEWDRLKGAGADSPGAAADRFQKLVDSVREEKKAIEEHNERVLEEAKKSKDAYDIFCKGCNVVTRTLARDKFVLWTDLFGEKQRTLDKEPGVFYYDDKKIERFLTGQPKSRIDSLLAELESLKKALPERYPFLHVIADVQQPVDLRLHLRGDPYNLGDPVPRHFLSILSQGDPVPFRNGSGRLELAEAIASPQNPLTARVMVNRIWQHHFGAGIVRTPSNFGLVGDRPSHPELLDYLASRFVESHWSVKALHREIMLSAAYALSSETSAPNAAADPDNRLFWRANRSRLDVEALRDSILFVAGKLDLTMGGPAFTWDKASTRRTVYGKVSRFRLERMLSLFDFPDPVITCEQRAATSVPPQKLFFLNSDLVSEGAKALAGRLHGQVPGDEARIQRAYLLLFGRAASPSELSKGMAFLRASEADDTGAAWLRYAQVLLSSNEFSFVD